MTDHPLNFHSTFPAYTTALFNLNLTVLDRKGRRSSELSRQAQGLVPIVKSARLRVKAHLRHHSIHVDALSEYDRDISHLAARSTLFLGRRISEAGQISDRLVLPRGCHHEQSQAYQVVKLHVFYQAAPDIQSFTRLEAFQKITTNRGQSGCLHDDRQDKQLIVYHTRLGCNDEVGENLKSMFLSSAVQLPWSYRGRSCLKSSSERMLCVVEDGLFAPTMKCSSSTFCKSRNSSKYLHADKYLVSPK